MNGIYLFVILLFSWIAAIYFLSPYIRKSRHFSLFGPAIMLKFVKNRGVIESISKKFPAKTFARVSVVIVILAGIVALISLAYSAYLASFIRPSQAPPVTEFLGIPGINPVIPIGYGIVALVISVVVHELMHGVTAKKHGLKVDSVGVLFFIVPVGAFVEPDESEMMQADPVVRRRIFAAGPGINIIIGVLLAIIISTVMFSSAVPMHQGVYVQSSDTNVNPSIIPGNEIIAIGNYTGNNVTNALINSNIPPGTNVSVSLFNGKTVERVQALAGIVIVSTLPGYPAANVSVPSNSILLSINNTEIRNETVLADVLDAIPPGNSISMKVMVMPSHTVRTYNMTTTSAYRYYAQYDPSANNPAYKGYSFIGISISYMGITGYQMGEIRDLIFMRGFYSNPVEGFIEAIGLPFYGFNPVPSAMADLFSVPFNPLIFWGMVNTFYWFFWINILLGITNALPFAFFDGGQFFKDTLIIAGRRFKALSSEKVVNQVMYFMSFLVLFLIMWELIIPRII
ncbi:site-2 protease family protein [Thermoplasma sp.]|uniref:site-2 protease family protein n=1 Tax=Thermoplasma sp. TaxID=1973142 RepID=UPI002637D33F|nr:site-2 protease family protein [Thermoplasma sp.]